jgi:hypothetical protein
MLVWTCSLESKLDVKPSDSYPAVFQATVMLIDPFHPRKTEVIHIAQPWEWAIPDNWKHQQWAEAEVTQTGSMLSVRGILCQMMVRILGSVIG